ncbi:MAG: beta-propeller fold lactonase family protein [Planctomycetota bacterium]
MRLAIGSYTSKPAPQGVSDAAITLAELDPKTGKLAVLATDRQAQQPSWVAWSPDGRTLFATAEGGDPSRFASYAVGPEGSLNAASDIEVRGRAFCHLAASPDRLYAAAYSSGSLAVVAVDGATLGPVVASHAYQGSGPNARRQKAPHAHHAALSPDGRWLYVCDLGSDRVWTHDTTTAACDLVGSTELPAGSGPRHLAFHPTRPIVYVWCELRPMVVSFQHDPATGELADERAHDLEADFDLKGVDAGAAVRVHPSGDLLAMSERKNGRVIMLGLTDGQIDGRVAAFASGATEPRDFNFSPDGRWLLVACQESHWVRTYRLDDDLQPASEPADELRTRMPVCLAFAP